MSGFAGVFHLDGAPVDHVWLETMAVFLAFRGPDGSQIWISGSAGLCHTLLRTSAETDARPQINSLDGNSWIAGDVRIDDRETLFTKLPNSPETLRSSSSSELVLHAYAVWGEGCVEHLLGDFSFVIWDARRRRVFCARDHLGIKLLFYARVGQYLIVSNTQDCIRQVPIVSDELNEQAIGDFLIAGMNHNPRTTFFGAIQRLPPAHRLIAKPDGLRSERYWTLPIDQPLYYARTRDYVDRFRELLRAAVSDRLPDCPLGIFMSGGLDSPALAATAVQLGAKPEAFTWVFDRLIPDQERHFSGLVAQYLGIPIHYNVQDDEPWGWETGSASIRTPEPPDNPLRLIASEMFVSKISAQARVFFFGAGPDAALLYEWRSHLNHLIRQHRWGRICADLTLHIVTQRRIPLLPTIPRMLRNRRGNQPDWYEPAFPQWLNPQFEASLGLKDRLSEILTGQQSPHPIRPKAHAAFAGDFPLCGNGGDWGVAGVPIEALQPFGDLRLLRFLMAVPAVPWCRDKYLIRTALRDWVPEAVRLRPKSPVPGFPYLVRARHSEQPVLPALSALNRYVDATRLPKWPGQNREELDSILRVMGLQYWLLGVQSSKLEDTR